MALPLLVVVQLALDLAMRMAADEGWGVPASYAEAFELLRDHTVIDVDTAARLKGMAAVRKRIAHGYASVDFARIWTELPDGIAAMDRLVTAIAARARPAGA